jgi:hypothetical protein
MVTVCVCRYIILDYDISKQPYVEPHTKHLTCHGGVARVTSWPKQPYVKSHKKHLTRHGGVARVTVVKGQVKVTSRILALSEHFFLIRLYM